jgi:hypothetical protein
MLWPLVPNDLAQVVHVDLLTGNRTGIEVVILVGRLATVPLARDGWFKVIAPSSPPNIQFV